jgi:hypothetical protein
MKHDTYSKGRAVGAGDGSRNRECQAGREHGKKDRAELHIDRWYLKDWMWRDIEMKASKCPIPDRGGNVRG